MNTNTPQTAPQIADVAHSYEEWHKNHIGNKSTFYKFMTTPSVERDNFVKNAGVAFVGETLCVTLSNN